MPQYKMVVFTQPKEGREDDYNEWYQHTHLAEIVALPGITGAQRLKLSATLGEGDRFPYLAIYDISTDEVGALVKRLETAATNGELTMSDAVDFDLAQATIYQVFGEPIGASQ